MTTSTPNLALVLYNSTTDSAEYFSNFRAVIAGTSLSSNFYKIDTAYGTMQAEIDAIQAGAYLTLASFISANYYEATVTGITSYVTGMKIILSLDTASAGTVTLNINSLGIKSVMKIDSSGTPVNISSGELMVGKYYFFAYDGTRWVWVDSTSGDQIYISGTSGNVVTVGSDNTLSGSTTPEILVNTAITNSSAKTTPVGADSILVKDSAAPTVPKEVELSNLYKALGTGTQDSTTFLSGNGTYISPSGGVPVARVMGTGNVVIASALENGDTLNGVTLVTGDTVLLAFQTTAAENGLYTVPASGAASRHPSYSTWASLVGLTVAVSEGTVLSDTLWLSKANGGGTIGSTAINFKAMFTQEWSAEYATYSSVADSGGTVIPYDDTIPQVTEGSQILTLTFTPVSDTIEIETGVPVAFGVDDGRATIAIFKDGAANAISASAAFISNSYLVGVPIICKKRVTSLTPGTQVVITVRVGPGSGNGTMYINGISIGRKYGGVSSAYLKVWEVNAGA